MIDLRFHIISLVAVFLSLALGILLGSSVIQGAIVERLESDIRRYRQERDNAAEVAQEKEAENRLLTERSQDDFVPWAVHQRLEAAEFVVVSDGSLPEWRDHVIGALEDAGAEASGTIVLEDRWHLPTPAGSDELVRAVERAVGTTLAPTRRVVESAMELFGERFFDQPSAGRLIDELESAGFISVPDRPSGEWPAPGSLVVMLSESRARAEALTPGATAFVSALTEAARVPGMLVLTDTPDGSSLVRLLRDDRRLPDNLSTFDSATGQRDLGGLGVVAALVAATEARGGHFGGEEGRAFVAPPSTAG